MGVTATALRELHRIHTQLADLRERLDRGPKQIKARQINVTQSEERLAKAQADVKTARVHSDQKQLQLKTAESKILDLKAKLNACSTNREYQALRDQIAADEMACSVLSDEILESMEQIDILRAGVPEFEQQVTKAKDELGRASQALKDQEQNLLTDVKRLEADLAEAEKALPNDFRDGYNRIVKAKGQDAMAPVEGDTCGGCFQQLTANIMNELIMARAVFCKNCGRLLYLPEDRTPGKSS